MQRRVGLGEVSEHDTFSPVLHGCCFQLKSIFPDVFLLIKTSSVESRK